MRKLFAVLASTAVFCLASPLSHAQQSTAGAGSETVPSSEDRPEEHVRHMRAHKKARMTSETEQNTEAPEATVVKATENVAQEGGKSSPAPAKVKPKKLAQKPKPRIAPERVSGTRPMNPTGYPAPRSSGFLEDLFGQE